MAGKISEIYGAGAILNAATLDLDADGIEVWDQSAGITKVILFREIQKALGLATHEVHIRRNANQTGVGVSTVLTFNTAIRDPRSIYSGTSHVVVPTGCTQMRGMLYVPLLQSGYAWIEERTSGGTSVGVYGRGQCPSEPFADTEWVAVTAGNFIFGICYNAGAAATLTNGAWPSTGTTTPPTNMQLWFR